jgi:hypothetical protein
MQVIVSMFIFKAVHWLQYCYFIFVGSNYGVTRNRAFVDSRFCIASPRGFKKQAAAVFHLYEPLRRSESGLTSPMSPFDSGQLAR